MEMGSLDKKTELALRFKQVPFIKIFTCMVL
jgi:hypothetical protein